jgi:hypothetical protein
MADHIELLINHDTLDTRWVVASPGEGGFHAGFTREDSAAGWTRACTIPAKGMTEADIRGELAKVRESTQAYWHELLSERAAERVVYAGDHFVMHELGGTGFYGASFRVHWLDRERAPVECSLSGQGPVPAWLRPQLPDNAVRIECLDDGSEAFVPAEQSASTARNAAI